MYDNVVGKFARLHWATIEKNFCWVASLANVIIVRDVLLRVTLYLK
jgi:hypothetical protein